MRIFIFLMLMVAVSAPIVFGLGAIFG